MNYANPDMVGHTGILEAAVRAVKTVDECMIEVVRLVREKGGVTLITADHGNCEMMVCPQTGNPFTAHTCEKVPFILVSDEHIECQLWDDAILSDIAPTILELLDLPVPAEMTGKSLLRGEA